MRRLLVIALTGLALLLSTGSASAMPPRDAPPATQQGWRPSPPKDATWTGLKGVLPGRHATLSALMAEIRAEAKEPTNAVELRAMQVKAQQLYQNLEATKQAIDLLNEALKSLANKPQGG